MDLQTKIKQWESYQLSHSAQDRKERITNLNLESLVTKDSKVLDVGCSSGYFCDELADKVSRVAALDPYVELINESPNVEYIPLTFGDFFISNKESFDLILSLAVTPWICKIDKCSEQQLVENYYQLLEPNGLLVQENIVHFTEHSDIIIKEMKEKFTLLKSGISRDWSDKEIGNGKRYYYLFRKTK